MSGRLIDREHRVEDGGDTHLRPQRLDDFIGQAKAKQNLRVFIAAAKGYGQLQARAAVAAALRKGGDDQPAEKLIQLALRELVAG